MTLLDQGVQVASGASGNRRGILKPHVTRTAGILNQFNVLAFARTLEKLNELQQRGETIEYQLNGVLQLIDTPGIWPDFGPALAGTKSLSQRAASELAGIPLLASALHFPTGGWVNAGSFCAALINDCNHVDVRLPTAVPRIERRNRGWRVFISANKRPNYIDTDVLILATGAALSQTPYTRELAITVTAGQTTECRYTNDAQSVHKTISGRRFVIPDNDYCTIGASYWRNNSDLVPTNTDTTENLRQLSVISQTLPAMLKPVNDWRALRATTPDRLPLLGPVPNIAYYRKAYEELHHGPRHKRWPFPDYYPGLYLLGGFGSRGIVSATLCAAMLLQVITGATQSPGHAGDRILQTYMPLVHPARFLLRTLQRTKQMTH